MADKDMAEKTLEEYDDVFADIVNVLLFQGECRVMESELEQAVERSVYKAGGKLREQERDTAKYWKKLNIHLALFGLENQTEPDRDEPLRVIGYDGAAYRGQLFYTTDENGVRRRNGNPRYPVVTLVLYFGLKRWNAPTTLYGCFGDALDESIRPYVKDYGINLFEIAYLTEEQAAMFRSDFRIVADYFIQLRKTGRYEPAKEPFLHVTEILQLMSALTGDGRFEEAAAETMKGERVKNMCEVMDRVESRGRKEGRIQGRKEGVIQGRIQEYVALRREDGYTDDKLVQGIMERFGVKEEEAHKYVAVPFVMV